MSANQAVCLKCGVKKGTGNRFCHNCGKPVDPNAAVCLSCGVSIKGSGAGGDNLNGQSKITMAVICFFLGGLGIHNFMMGETKKGVMKIVLAFFCGIGFIFALIDFIKILTDKYIVEPDKFV